MRITYIAGSLLGGLVVFAACAAQNAKDGPASVQTETDSGSFVDAVLDSVGVELDTAVKDAGAAPGDPWTKVSLSCSTPEPSGGSQWYALGSFPGRSKEDLARSAAVVCFGGDEYCLVQSFEVKDGGVRVPCGAYTNKGIVTLVVPPPL